jgi:hypothetical protein
MIRSEPSERPELLDPRNRTPGHEVARQRHLVAKVSEVDEC